MKGRTNRWRHDKAKEEKLRRENNGDDYDDEDENGTGDE